MRHEYLTICDEIGPPETIMKLPSGYTPDELFQIVTEEVRLRPGLQKEGFDFLFIVEIDDDPNEFPGFVGFSSDFMDGARERARVSQ